MTTLFVVNKSTLVSNEDVQTMTRACAHQVRYHAAPLFGLHYIPVVYLSDEKDAPAGSYVIAVLDDSDQQGALGWHTEDTGDIIYGEVFAKPVLDNGGDALTKDLSIASVLSHEVLETFADPHANLYAADLRGKVYSFEICDPVESDSYVIKVDKTKVTVSNFVTPAWFDPQAATGSQFDYLGNVKAPFTMSKGGYVVYSTQGNPQQKFDETYPEYRKQIKARPHAKRLKEAHAKAEKKTKA